ncbi:MAG: acylphosphatase [Deinococcota bacterium]|jgi:acylphosphatase|nr:acylphosphatase [Deinococcota bacterium]
MAYDNDDSERLTALVSGTVQGVGYRAFARRIALDMQLAGYAENLGDGRVEVVAEGPREELAAFAHQLKRGPAHAQVAGVELQWGESSGLKDFYVY